MKTLRKITEYMIDEAITTFQARLEKRGFVPYDEAHNMLEIQLQAFESYYTDGLDIPPFSEEFVNHIYKEYERCIKGVPGIKVRTLTDEEASSAGLQSNEVYGFDEKQMESGIQSLRKRTG